MIRAREEKPGLGVGLIMLTYICFTSIDTSAKWLVLAGIPVAQVVFVRYLGHLVMVVGTYRPEPGDSLWRMKSPVMTLTRGFMLILATFANFTALQFLPLTVTVSIFFIAPLLVTAFAAIFLKEKVGPRRWAAIFIGFAGVIIITRPWGASFHWAMLVSLIPPISTTIYALITRKLAGVRSPTTMQFWAAVAPLVLIGPFAFSEWTWPSGGISWFTFIAIGFFGWAGHQLFTVAHRYAEASLLAPLTYISIVYMSLSSWLIFHQPPDMTTIIGATVIISSGVYIWMRERKIAAA